MQKNDNNPDATVAEILTFPKSERLRHKLLLEKLFSRGGSLMEYPVRLVWNSLSTEELRGSFRNGEPEGIAPLQVMISVPKKRRRHAVDRVLLRRRMREAWRRQRRPLRNLIESIPALRTVSVALIYVADSNIDYTIINRKISKLIEKLAVRIEEQDNVEQIELSSKDCS